MGRTTRWLKSLLIGKKEDRVKEKKKKEEEQEKGGSHPSLLLTETHSAPISVPSSREKRRWSFRRSGGVVRKDSNVLEPLSSTPIHDLLESEMDQKRHAMAVAVATAAAADAAVAAAQAAAAVIRLTTKATEEASAIKIQAAFRGYLARKALCALKGLVKLQALVRGHLVRKQAAATLRCMQALVTAQERARVQRIQMLKEAQANSKRQPSHRRSPQHPRRRQSYDMDNTAEENVKIVEMDFGESRSSSKSRHSYSVAQTERINHGFSSYSGTHSTSKFDAHQQVFASPSGLTDMSPRVCSGHFGEFSFTTAQSSPQFLSCLSVPEARKNSFTLSRGEGSYSMSHDYYSCPNYMANTESSRAKARSQSAPKQRPDSLERPPSRRRQSVEGRNVPRNGRMQRSSSHLVSTANRPRYPRPMNLDKSSTSLKASECGSTSTVLTNTNHCRSLAAYEAYGCM